MKILQVNKFLYPKGGSETYMFELSNALKERGYEIEFWGMEDEKNIVEDKYDCFVKNIDFSDLGIIDKLFNSFSTIYSFEAKKKINIILDKFKPNIVHIHNFNFQLTPSILSEIKKRDIKIVYTAHDSQLVCPYHRLYNFQKDEICTKCINGQFSNCIKERCFDASLMKSSVGAIESYLYHGLDYYNKYIDMIISPSKFMKNMISNLYKKDIKIIPNFINYIEVGKVNKENYILYVGRVSKEKGIVDILPLFDKMKIELKIIGDGPEVKNILKSEYIEYLGSKQGKEKFFYIKQAKYVIQPSKWYESFGLLPIESFSQGTPVIVSNLGGFLETVEDGKNGFILNFNDDNIEKKLLDIFSYDNLQYQEYCLLSYSKYYTKETHISNIINIYKKVLNESV